MDTKTAVDKIIERPSNKIKCVLLITSNLTKFQSREGKKIYLRMKTAIISDSPSPPSEDRKFTLTTAYNGLTCDANNLDKDMSSLFIKTRLG